MTRPPAPDLSADEARRVAEFGIFAEEERVERVARAIYEAELPVKRLAAGPDCYGHYRTLARAAIAALDGTS